MEIPVKRFYLPEDLVETCPYCGEEVIFENYLSYPETGINKINFACQSGQDYDWGEDQIWTKETAKETGCIDGEFTVEYDLQFTTKRVGNLKEIDR